MARLSNFRVNSKAIEDGEWRRAGDEFDDLELFTRGFGDRYTDAKATKMRAAATRYGGDERKIPNAKQRSIIVECLIQHVIMDVRNLVGDDDKPVTFGKFCEMLHDPDHAPLVDAVIRAASQVGIIAEGKAEADLGN